MNILTNLKLIESGNIPTTSNLLKGEMAFGKVPLSGDIRLFVNDNNSVSELLLNKHNNLLGRDENDCHPIDAITGLRDLVNIIDVFYGVEWDTTIANPACRRIGNSLLHQTLPIHSKMRRCLLLDDGTVNYYLDANDSTLKEDGTPAILDGTDGQVMVEIPEYYRKFEAVGTKRRVMISEIALPGFTLIKKCYRSAYEAVIDRTTSTAKLCSVKNNTTEFRGGAITGVTNPGSGTGSMALTNFQGSYRDTLGMPTSGFSLTSFRQFARNRGVNTTTGSGWSCDTYTIQRDVHYLYVIEYANLNCQLPYNAALDANGYKQGGLGNGVTTLSTQQWYSFNNINPFIFCGYTDSLGNGNGAINYVMPDVTGGGSGATITYTSNVTAGPVVAGNFTVTNGGSGYTSEPMLLITGGSQNAFVRATISGGVVTGVSVVYGGSNFTTATVTVGAAMPTVSVPIYRGMENPFGHLWSWVDGILVNKSGSGVTYSGQAFVCEDPTKFSSTITSDYNLIGNLPNQTSNYIKEMIVGENMPLVIGNGATSTTFWSVYYYEDLVVGLRGVRFGGTAYNGAGAGFGCSSTPSAPSYTSALLGSRLCFIPE
jgi:hypothetical protein